MYWIFKEPRNQNAVQRTFKPTQQPVFADSKKKKNQGMISAVAKETLLNTTEYLK